MLLPAIASSCFLAEMNASENGSSTSTNDVQDSGQRNSSTDSSESDSSIICEPDNKLPSDQMIVSRGKSIGLLNITRGEMLREKKLDRAPCPFKTLSFDEFADRVLVTYITEFASPCAALVTDKCKVLRSRRNASLSAMFGEYLVLDVLEQDGPEGTSIFGTEIWSIRTGKLKAKFPHISRIYPAASDSGTGSTSIVLSGPTDETSIDVYGNTEMERVVKCDLANGEVIFDARIEKSYGSAFELLADTPQSTVLYYSEEQLLEEITALDSNGKVAWRYTIHGQLFRIPEYPFTGAIFRIACAVDEEAGLLALYIVHTSYSPRILLFNLSNGTIVTDVEIVDTAGFVTSLEFCDDGLIANIKYGKSAILLGIPEGKMKRTTPTESPPVIEQPDFEPITWTDVEREIAISINAHTIKAQIKGIEKQFPFANPSGRTPDVAGVYGDPPNLLHLKLSQPVLEQDIAATGSEMLLNLDTGKWLVGDELDANGWQYYGNTYAVVAENKLLILSKNGTVRRKVNLIPAE